MSAGQAAIGCSFIFDPSDECLHFDIIDELASDVLPLFPSLQGPAPLHQLW